MSTSIFSKHTVKSYEVLYVNVSVPVRGEKEMERHRMSGRKENSIYFFVISKLANIYCELTNEMSFPLRLVVVSTHPPLSR